MIPLDGVLRLLNINKLLLYEFVRQKNVVRKKVQVAFWEYMKKLSMQNKNNIEFPLLNIRVFQSTMFMLVIKKG